jgi:hypothetical protein
MANELKYSDVIAALNAFRDLMKICFKEGKFI